MTQLYPWLGIVCQIFEYKKRGATENYSEHPDLQTETWRSPVIMVWLVQPSA
jgi:hypothetical protein